MNASNRTSAAGVRVCLLIPAYKPSTALIDVVEAVRRDFKSVPIVVVDDGSGSDFQALFATIDSIPGVQVIRHAVNLGKGAALKTGFNNILVAYHEANYVVTADADGQHSPKDIARMIDAVDADGGNDLILGARAFAGDVPLRSKFGNLLTRQVLRAVTGFALSDTQTGLRAIPRSACLEFLRIPLNGYDFETECLVRLRTQRDASSRIRELPIDTVYIDGNSSSHFRPLRDSMRIYFVFLRYSFVSLASFLIDYAAFMFVHSALGFGVLQSQVSVRPVTATINFVLNRKLVFRSSGSVLPEYGRYLLSMVYILVLSGGLLLFLTDEIGLAAAIAKPLAEIVTFVTTFLISGSFVYGRPATSR